MLYPIFGYACISSRYPELKTGSTSTLTYLNRLEEYKRGPYLRTKARQNILNLRQLLKKTAEGPLRAYRLPDDFLPMIDLGYYSPLEFADDLAEIGHYANEKDFHISFHPSQFFVLNSATPRVVDSAIKNFDLFAEILDLFQLKNTPNLVTHVGAVKTYPTSKAACDAFIHNFGRLSERAKKFLVIENDQSAHSIDSCLYIHNAIKIPVVLDNAHYNYNPVPNLSLGDAAQLALATWGSRTPKMHLSSERETGGRHAHADFIDPEDFYSLYEPIKNSNTPQAIFMIEAKAKDQAALFLLSRLVMSDSIDKPKTS
jgi:UV DNA damage endonuclease